MRVAVTGVSGFIGSRLAEYLVRAGHSVIGLVRPTSRRDHLNGLIEQFVVGDQADASVWGELLADADAVIHNSVNWSLLKTPSDQTAHYRSNLLGSLGLLHASAPRPFVFISTIAVHYDMCPRWDGLIDEDHPLRPDTPYGAYKAAVEAHLWVDHHAHGRHACAIRPCGVYGIDPDLTRSIGYPLVKKIRSGKPFARSGGGKFVHVDDVAEAAVEVLVNPKAAGRAFNLADCYARWADWAKIIAEHLNIEIEIDYSSPASATNVFSKDAIQNLGIELDRGHDGIREYLHQLIEHMDQT